MVFKYLFFFFIGFADFSQKQEAQNKQQFENLTGQMGKQQYFLTKLDFVLHCIKLVQFLKKLVYVGGKHKSAYTCIIMVLWKVNVNCPLPGFK